jgi:DNA processing protein
VVVVESRVTGGSLSTVTEALVRGRTVLAVPGHPSMASAAGTNALLADGATIARDLEDVLVAIGRGGAAVVADGGHAGLPAPGAPSLSPDARAVLRLLEPGPQTLEHVVGGSGLDLEAAALALAELAASGRVVQSGGWYQQIGEKGGRRADGADR